MALKWRITYIVMALFSITLACNYFLGRRGIAQRHSNMFNVAFPPYKPATYYDPAKIHLAFEYVFLENIYSPLLEYSPDGELVSSIAKRFEWIGNEAYLHIRQDLHTIDNYPINAYDVEASIKRLFIVGGNTHGDLKNMLCPEVKLTSLKDVCPGMIVKDNGSTIVMKFKEQKPFLFPMLTAIDFAVIPQKSINAQTLAIIDYRNTSGPYYVEKDSSRGDIILSANSQHFHYSEKIPQKIKLVPFGRTDIRESIKLFAKNEVDHITTIDRVPEDVVIDFAKEHEKTVNLHRTYPINLYIVVFTKKGCINLTVRERKRIGKTLKSIFNNRFLSKPGYETASQIFPLEGALSAEELLDLERGFGKPEEDFVMEKTLNAWDVVAVLKDDMQKVKRFFPNTTFSNIPRVPAFVDFKKDGLAEPDFYITSTDTGFQEDVSLLSYHLNSGLLVPHGQSKEAWLYDYIKTLDKTQRIGMMRKLQYDTLKYGISVPLAMSPYVAIVRKPWQLHMSKLHANNPIWRIRRN